MRKYLVYLIIYSIGGWILERIINLLFLQQWVDNKVLFLPIQPMYGLGVVLTVFIFYTFINKLRLHIAYKTTILIITAILTTAFSEGVSGMLYEFLTGTVLWDYGDTFTCAGTYVCVLPTSLFGVISAFIVIYIHPHVKTFTALMPSFLQQIVIVIFIIDIVYTLSRII